MKYQLVTTIKPTLMKHLITFLLLSFAGTINAENRQHLIDSLQSRLKTTLNDTTRANILNDISGYLIDMGKYEEAMTYAIQGKTLSERVNFKTGISSAFRKMAGIQLQQGEYPKSLENFLHSSRIGNANEQFFANRGIGTVYYYQHDYNSALKYFFKCYNYNKNDGYTCSFIGNVYLDKKDYNSALDYYNKSLQSYTELENENGISAMMNSIGTIYEYENKNDSALVWYFKSLKIKQKVGDYQGVCDALGGIGDVYFKQKKYSASIKNQLECLELSKKIGYLISIKLTEQRLSEIYEQLGDKGKSFDHYKQYIIMRDSMFNEENTKNMVRTEMNFQFQKKEELAKYEQDKKDAIKKEELKNQRIQLNIFIGGFAIVLLFSVFLFRSFKKTQRQRNIIREQKKILEHSKKELTDNIQYSKRIQDAVMTPISQIQKIIPNSFVLNMARDTVSGDFLFMEKYKDEIIIAVADCTNHSVSGAMMSILCNNLLGEAIVNGNHIPSDILNYINTSISKKFHQTEYDNSKEEMDIVKDGMDVIIIKLDLINMKYQYAGAYNPLLLIRENQVIEIKADKLQLGQTKEKYKNNEGELQKDDVLYMSSDGYADQFSSSGKKFMKKKFKELLVSINQKHTSDQKSILEQTICQWKNGYEQTDDILVMGIKI